MMKKEVCNAYTELNDPIRQRELFEQQAMVCVYRSINIYIFPTYSLDLQKVPALYGYSVSKYDDSW